MKKAPALAGAFLNRLHGGQPEIFDTPSFVFRMLHQLPRQPLRFGVHFPTTLFQKIFFRQLFCEAGRVGLTVIP